MAQGVAPMTMRRRGEAKFAGLFLLVVSTQRLIYDSIVALTSHAPVSLPARPL
jgi:hypothetical protein